jgi:hypothetical protein
MQVFKAPVNRMKLFSSVPAHTAKPVHTVEGRR